jgi:hypothetical protein
MNVRLEWLYKKKEATFGLCRPAEASTKIVYSLRFVVYDGLTRYLFLRQLTVNYKP